MDERLKRAVLAALRGIIPCVRGILVYGSLVKGYADERSDIDICVIKKEGIKSRDLYERILEVSADEKYDIVEFNEMPWYLKGAVLEKKEVIYAEDEDELDFWLYKQLKIWSDLRRRQRVASAADLISRLRRGRLDKLRGGRLDKLRGGRLDKGLDKKGG